MDETYVKVAGRWRYVCRAVDQYGQIIDVYVAVRRDTKAACRFFARAIRAWRSGGGGGDCCVDLDWAAWEPVGAALLGKLSAPLGDCS